MIDPLDLHAFADGELDRNEAAKLRSALATDPTAQAEHDSVLNLKDMLRSRAMNYEADDCWKSCVGRLNEIDKSRRVESFVGRYAWAMCTVLFVLILGGRYMVKDMHGDTAQTADLYRMFSGRNSTPTVTPEQQRLYSNVLRRARVAIGAAPVDHSVGTFQDLPIQRYVFRGDGQGPIMLYVVSSVVNFEDTAELPTEPGVYTGVLSSPVGDGQVNCLIWHDNGSTLVLAGPQAIQDLETVRGRIPR